MEPRRHGLFMPNTTAIKQRLLREYEGREDVEAYSEVLKKVFSLFGE